MSNCKNKIYPAEFIYRIPNHDSLRINFLPQNTYRVQKGTVGSKNKKIRNDSTKDIKGQQCQRKKERSNVNEAIFTDPHLNYICF